MKLKSNSGFSLVELMVVVAIIGILATIAVPNFQRFTARAKQSSAKTELTGIYTAEKAFSTEYQTYHSALPGVGYVPEGVQSADDYPVVATNRGRVYATTAGVTAIAANVTMGAGLPFSGTYKYAGAFFAHSGGCTETTSAMSTMPTGLAAASGAATFVAVAAGCPASVGQAADKTDVWSIDDTRALVNNRAGIDK